MTKPEQSSQSKAEPHALPLADLVSCPWKSGDRVMLKSGGPSMTVLDVGRSSGLVFCRWKIDGTDRNADYPAVALRSHNICTDDIAG